MRRASAKAVVARLFCRLPYERGGHRSPRGLFLLASLTYALRSRPVRSEAPRQSPGLRQFRSSSTGQARGFGQGREKEEEGLLSGGN